jgi:hypothetical protein
MSTTYVSTFLEETTQVAATIAVTQVTLRVRRPDAHQLTLSGSVESMTRLRDALLSVLPLAAEVKA